MSNVEQRLRDELAELAEWLVPVVVDVEQSPERGATSTRHRLAAVVVVLLVVSGVAALIVRGGIVESTVETEPAASTAAEQDAPVDVETVGFGTWRPMATAPIPSRSHAVAAWTGGEVVIWAGSDEDRTFAYSDGAAYDPATDSWRSIPVPGWGHPGLTGAFDGRQLYVLAKGGATRFDPGTEVWSDLPDIPGRFASAIVAADGTVWVLGPASFGEAGPVDIAVFRLDESSQSWIGARTYKGSESDIGAIEAMRRLEISPIWTGDEIVVWDPAGGGPAFDPVAGSWRRIPAPTPDTGRIVGSVAVATDSGLLALVETRGGERVRVSTATLAGDTWTWGGGPDLPMAGVDGLSVASVGDWLVILRPDGPPVIVQLSSGAWEVASDGPLVGLSGASVVRTGSGLVIWGGVVLADSEAGAAPPVGVAWSPP